MSSESAFHFNSIIGGTPVEKVGPDSRCLISDLSILQMFFMKAVYTKNLNFKHYKHPIKKIWLVCLFHVDSGSKSLNSAFKLRF